MGFRDVMRNGKGRRVLPALVIFLTLALGIALGTMVSQGVRASKEEKRPSVIPIAMPSPAQLSASFAAIAESVEPTVVNIRSESVIQVTRRRPRSQQREGPFGDLFDRFFGTPEGGPPPRQSNLGSGLIVDEQGYILTNHHVVVRGRNGGSGRPDPRTPPRRRRSPPGIRSQGDRDRPGNRFGCNQDRCGHPCLTLEFGDSESMRVGDWVLAVGSPFGLRSTVTAGIISAKGRDLEPGRRTVQIFIFRPTPPSIPATAAALWVNLAGQVIGINTAIVTRSRGYDGVGSPSPPRLPGRSITQSLSQGESHAAASGSLSMPPRMKPCCAVLASTMESLSTRWNRAARRQSGHPARRRDTRRGRTSVSDGDDLVEIIAATPVGDEVKIEILRDGKRKNLDVEIADRSVLFARDLGTDARRSAMPPVGEKETWQCRSAT